MARRRDAPDGFLRETFSLPRDEARAKAKAFLKAYPKAAYMTEVERWRELPGGAIEFTMRRLRTADWWPTRTTNAMFFRRLRSPKRNLDISYWQWHDVLVILQQLRIFNPTLRIFSPPSAEHVGARRPLGAVDVAAIPRHALNI
jgi:hypothetical protein